MAPERKTEADRLGAPKVAQPLDEKEIALHVDHNPGTRLKT